MCRDILQLPKEAVALTRTSLFAQPADFEPSLKVEHEIFPSFSSIDDGKIIHLNDIGRVAWLTAKKLNPKATLRLDSYDPSGYEWAVTITGPSLIITLKSIEPRRKRSVFPGLRSVRNFIVGLEFQGGHYATVRYVKKLVSDMGRKPYDILEWEDFLNVFGISKPDVEKQWLYLLNTDIASDVRGIYDEVQREISGAKAEQLEVAGQAESLMAQAEGAIEEEDYDTAINILETARGILRDAHSLAKQIEVRKEMAADMISFVQSLIIKATRDGVDTARPQKLLTDAAAALGEREDWETASKNAMQARNLVELEMHRREQALAALETSRSMIDDARRLGLNVGNIVALQKKAEETLQLNDYAVVINYTSTIRNNISRLKRDYQQVLDKKESSIYALDAAQKVLDDARKAGADVRHIREQLMEANLFFEKGDYNKALEGAESVRRGAEETQKAFCESRDIVTVAINALNEAGNFVDTSKISPYLEKAKTALKKNDYLEAINMATMCKDMVEVSQVESEPKIEVNIRSQNLKGGLWNRTFLDVINVGTAHAKNIAIRFSGQVEATRLQRILFLRANEKTEAEIGFKPSGSGEMPYDVETLCARAFDGVGYTQKSHKWLTVGQEVTPELPGSEEEEGRVEKSGSHVDEIYVVYHDGRLIFHESRREVEEEVDDMILSSMLTAVQRFVKDSFKQEEGLGKLEFGNLKLVLEHGEVIYIAVVVSGKVPPSLRTRMRGVIKTIEQRHFDKLALWDGNMTELEDTHDEVRSIFEAAGEQKEQEWTP